MKRLMWRASFLAGGLFALGLFSSCTTKSASDQRTESPQASSVALKNDDAMKEKSASNDVRKSASNEYGQVATATKAPQKNMGVSGADHVDKKIKESSTSPNTPLSEDSVAELAVSSMSAKGTEADIIRKKIEALSSDDRDRVLSHVQANWTRVGDLEEQFALIGDTDKANEFLLKLPPKLQVLVAERYAQRAKVLSGMKEKMELMDGSQKEAFLKDAPASYKKSLIADGK